MCELTVDKNNIDKYFDGWYDGTSENWYDAVSTSIRKGIELCRVRYVLDQIPIEAKSVLDHGCGQGRWIPLLAKKFPGSEIVGIEVSKNGVEIARQSFPDHKFFVFDGETAPFPDNKFDLIFSYHVLDVVWDLDKSLRDISRLLKKGGFLCIVIPCGNKNSFEERMMRLIVDSKESLVGGGTRFFYSYPAHIRRMESEELIRMLARNDVAVYKEFYSGQFWSAVEWLSKSNLSFINSFFNHKKAVNVFAKLKLRFLKMLFVFLFVAVKLSAVDLHERIRCSKSKVRKIVVISLMPFKPISIIFGSILTLVSFLEWHFLKRSKNGSCQYLIFTK